ncbi:hypothetical protein EDD11_007278 [Mortierella claussenii]|nr:hypothetical protein EDD11_007278 [Mortierella claussenii]
MVQLRKNIKIAWCIMLELSKFGLEYPPQLSLHEAAWNAFIVNTARHLKNLLEHYHEYALNAKEKTDIFHYTQNTVGREEKEEGTEIEHESDLEVKEIEDDGDLDEKIGLIAGVTLSSIHPQSQELQGL